MTFLQYLLTPTREINDSTSKELFKSELPAHIEKVDKKCNDLECLIVNAIKNENKRRKLVN